ncbi:hypothetical protein XU18_5045 [Perkinsela sp. CCAP 1560/4]|nr:hypothetical protein XU18_5045 [Perkinsela sp. CCAP 1560/4]|eukprot:KNH03192.1 hypothetical protein XU18_5045 [Perkinsela sp. CCAP 1560/4]
MSDWAKGIITMQKKLFANALHFHCTKHIIDNCRKASTGKYHDGLVWGIRLEQDKGQVQQKPGKSTIEAPIRCRLLSAHSCRVLVFVTVHQNSESPRQQD